MRSRRGFSNFMFKIDGYIRVEDSGWASVKMLELAKYGRESAEVWHL